MATSLLGSLSAIAHWPTNLRLPFSHATNTVPLATAFVAFATDDLDPDDLMVQGAVQFSQNQITAAIESWQQAYTLYEQSEIIDGKLLSLFNLGLAFTRLGDYPMALQKLEQALAIPQISADPEIEGIVLSSLGEIHNLIGNYQDAIQKYERSLALARSLQDSAEEARILGNLGQVYFRLEQTDEAIRQYTRSLEIAETNLSTAEANNDSQGIGLATKSIGYAHLNIGIALTVQATIIGGELTEAINHYHQSLAAAESLRDTNFEDKKLEASVYRSLGTAYDQSHDYSEAIAQFSKSLDIFQSINEPLDLSRTYNNRAHALLEWGKAEKNNNKPQLAAERLQQAESDLILSIRILDMLRDNLDTDIQRVSIFDTQVKTYNLLQQVLITQGGATKQAEALKISELSRARALTTQVTKNLNYTLAPPTPESLKAIAQAHNATIVEYSMIPKDHVIHQGKFAGEAGELYIWVIKPTEEPILFKAVDLTSLEINNQRISLETLIADSRETIDIRARGGLAIGSEAPKKDLSEQLKALHQVLIAPIAQWLPENEDDKIIFIPHRDLFLVPFAALQDEDERYFIEDHTLLSAPSIQLLDLTTQQRRALNHTGPLQGHEMLIVGNPMMPAVNGVQLADLTHAQTEATEIAKQFNTQALIGAQATEKKVRERSLNARLIHLATHGLLDYEVQRSNSLSFPGAIALTPSHIPNNPNILNTDSLTFEEDTTEDGLLTANEISQLSLTAELVVLSACDTGQGEISGDGVLGLSRSLILAGVPSMIVTLWAIPDAPTATLMQRFYQEWQKTDMDKAQALRAAMISTLETPNITPQDWAAFTLIGEFE